MLVVGAGGIGCPAAWALAERGVGRLTLVDPDVVELSNLPRQVLYVPEDLGSPKALAAAERLAGAPGRVRGLHARLDDENAPDLLADVDVLIDATDGARTKDWLNQLAVRSGLPYVHAAGLRSEARLLAVAAGGRPCLACLFGRLEAETGSCADLGVWGGVVGSIGFLAAETALVLLSAPLSPLGGYRVLDFEGGRHLELGAACDERCPVCARFAPEVVEPFPGTGPACAPEEINEVADTSRTQTLDLRTERCPLNLLRSRQALEAARPGTVVEILLGEEGAATVPDGVRALGHTILASAEHGPGLRLRVRAGAPARRGAGASPPRLNEHELQRFARQVVLPEVGEAGQQRLRASSVLLAGSGLALRVAAVYLAAAGVGRVIVRTTADEAEPASVFAANAVAAARARAVGTVVAAVEEERADLVVWVGGARPVPVGVLGSRPALVLSASDGGLGLRADWRAPLRALPGAAAAHVVGAILADAAARRLVTGNTPLCGVGLAGLLPQRPPSPLSPL